MAIETLWNPIPVTGDPWVRIDGYLPKAVKDSIPKAVSFLKSMATARAIYTSSTLTPTPVLDRHAIGPWSGTYTNPVNPHPTLPYTPILITGPLWFPITPGARVDFKGRVDVPFYSMDGWSGHRMMLNPDPPPDLIEDPSTIWSDGGVNWGRYLVVGSVDGVTQFIAPTMANATWAGTVAVAPPGQWTFQLITYKDAADAGADTNRILVGNPWRESERPGDVRGYYGAGYTPRAPQFTDVRLITGVGGADNQITGRLQAFGPKPGFTYQILATNETDVEYAWALKTVTGGGLFTISKPSYQAFGGKMRLRLLEQVDHCSTRQVGVVWMEENSLDQAAQGDLRIEYRAMTTTYPTFPTSTQPAQKDNTWLVLLSGGGAIGRVSLVNCNTKRILGEYTMGSGLMRSFIVEPEQAGQDTSSVYYDGFLDTCFCYDQAVALIALMQVGERDAAAQLVDALLTAQNPDGSYPLALQQGLLFQHDTSVIRTGIVGWVCYALLLAASPLYSSWFPTSTADAAKKSLNYIISFTNARGTVNGGKGQTLPDGTVDPAYVVPWWSMEHNIDAWWCLDLAHRLFGSQSIDYAGKAEAMKAALLSDGWDASKGIFWQGGVVSGGVSTPDGMHALDTHSWGAALLEKWRHMNEAEVSLERADDLYSVTDAATGWFGYTTFIPEDGYPAETVKTPWYEGSFGVALAKRGFGQLIANDLLAQLVKAQRDDGSYLYVLQPDPTTDVWPWPCLIAPAWNIVAISGEGTPYTRVVWT